MTSSSDKKNQSTLRRMPPVLFPTRRFAIASRGGYTDDDDDPNAVQWIGMNPLDMLSHLARATEEKEVAKGIFAPSITIGDTKLSSATPPVPRLATGRNKKRAVNDIAKTEVVPNPLAPWDLSFLLEKDEHAAGPVDHLQFLARTVESMPHYAFVGGSYERIRAYVEGTSTWIHSSYSGQLSAQSAAEKMSLLQSLYAETIQQMEGLVEMTRMLGPLEAEDAEFDTKKEPLPKNEFAEYMTKWLKKHWTNPYPDDAGLEQMASDCGTTATVVGNWLINARTRKWRPAVVKAFELNRPSHLLLEDSINLFEDKPLRDLTEYESFQVPQQATTIQQAPAYSNSNKRMKYF